MLRSKAFWTGVISAFAASAVIAAIVIYSGLVPMGAAQEPGPLDRIGNILFHRAVALRAESGTAPSSEEARANGLRLFADHCVHCHGAPGAPPARWVTGMLPRPPLLSSDHVQSWSDGELFYIVDQGVRMTGMPPFADDLSREERWQVVSAIRAMPALSGEEREALNAGREDEPARRQAAAHEATEEHQQEQHE